MKETKTTRIFTIGHSTRSISEFIQALETHKLKLVVDVRTIPKSRHNPQFGSARLAKSLKNKEIQYIHLPGLGGLRHALKDSKNNAWRNLSFRGYADYMQTEEFEKALRRLLSLSKRKRLAIMCAEALPWRCHRSLIADSLIARGYFVTDIFSETSAHPHKLTPFTKVIKRKVTYPIS
jgi:uncharacterized protein (DUF488 family)